jgi:seryl-tRNA synthetase
VHDIKRVREDPAGFDAVMARRSFPNSTPVLLQIDNEVRLLTTRQQELQQRRNEQSRQIGVLKKQGSDSAVQQAEVSNINEQITQCESVVRRLGIDLQSMLARLPNRLDPDVPDGADETDNLEQKQVGAIPLFAPGAKQHFELGESLGLMDFEAAARIAGARFTVLRGNLARLERALGQFMIDLHVTDHGYEETMVPGLVNDATLYGTGQLPKFADDCFKTTDGRWLIPTAEVPLTNMVAGQIVPPSRLPIRMTALTDCYRSEAGSAGRDTRGMLRQHQFRKVEMVSIVAPADSEEEHERMTRCAETVLEKLGLPYRRMLLCAGDTGFSAAKTYDLEVWLPGQQMWREISSCSNCRDFQARRMNARTRAPDGKGTIPVHTLNGSGVAVGRALIAVMENYQNQDGTITIPDPLRPYMNNLDAIRRA